MLIAPPKPGEDIRILAPNARLRGRIAARSDSVLTVELESTPIRRPYNFPAGTGIELQWVNGHGVVQMAVLVVDVHGGEVPSLELLPAGAPAPVAERRSNERRALELPLAAWSLARPTARLHGVTVDLSVGGALVRIPELPPLAATVELQLGLPDGPLPLSAAIRWRREPDLAGVEFTRIAPENEERLVELLAGR